MLNFSKMFEFQQDFSLLANQTVKLLRRVQSCHIGHLLHHVAHRIVKTSETTLECDQNIEVSDPFISRVPSRSLEIRFLWNAAQRNFRSLKSDPCLGRFF